MKSLVLFFSFLVAAALTPAQAFAEKETVDLMTFEPPRGWAKEVKANTYTVFTTTDKKAGTYCRIFVMLSIPSKGGVQEDFDSEWKNLVASQYTLSGPVKMAEPKSKDGWQIRNGTAPFTYSGAKGTASLTTLSGNGKAMSISVVYSSDAYLPAVRKFLDSVEMAKPPASAGAAQTGTAALTLPADSGATLGTTRFDDGWTSTAKDDWVQVTKGTTRVLIHYPNKAADTYNSSLLETSKTAWNVLVAPRYKGVKNLEFRGLNNWESIEFSEADAVEVATGKPVHVVLFKKHQSGGGGKYLEFITATKTAFEQEFAAFHESVSGWEKIEQMANYNKFIVSVAGMQGKWTTNFSGIQQYVNVNTGLDAGTNTHASSETFQLGPGNAYSWDLGVASGMVGNIKFQSAKAKGKFSVAPNGWQVTFSDLEGKPRTYDASFSHIKGLRILWLDGRAFAKAE